MDKEQWRSLSWQVVKAEGALMGRQRECFHTLEMLGKFCIKKGIEVSILSFRYPVEPQCAVGSCGRTE
jgi:hypothetical protein